MYELIYTSTQNGLTPGKSGFTTVACTNGMPPMYIGILESLSTYDPLYLPGNPLASQNPVDYAYRKIIFGSRTLRVFSRIAYAGLDYSGRSNIIAHHIIPEDRDNIENLQWGPVSVFLNPANFRKEWNEPAHKLPPRDIIPAGDIDMARYRDAAAWNRMFGSHTWAEAVARKFIGNAKSAVRQNLYATVQAGERELDLLALVAEIMPYLTPEQRNDFTFSTYFSRQPGNSSDSNCCFRCILSEPPYKYLPVIRRLQPEGIITRDIRPESFVDFSTPLYESEPMPDPIVLQGFDEPAMPAEPEMPQNNITQHIQVGAAAINRPTPQNNITQHIQIGAAQPRRTTMQSPAYTPPMKVEKSPEKPKWNFMPFIIGFAVVLIFGGVGTWLFFPSIIGMTAGQKVSEPETPPEVTPVTTEPAKPAPETTQPKPQPTEADTQKETPVPVAEEEAKEKPAPAKEETTETPKQTLPTQQPKPIEKKKITLSTEQQFKLFVEYLKSEKTKITIPWEKVGLPGLINKIDPNGEFIEFTVNNEYHPYSLEFKMKKEYMPFVNNLEDKSEEIEILKKEGYIAEKKEYLGQTLPRKFSDYKSLCGTVLQKKEKFQKNYPNSISVEDYEKIRNNYDNAFKTIEKIQKSVSKTKGASQDFSDWLDAIDKLCEYWKWRNSVQSMSKEDQENLEKVKNDLETFVNQPGCKDRLGALSSIPIPDDLQYPTNTSSKVGDYKKIFNAQEKAIQKIKDYYEKKKTAIPKPYAESIEKREQISLHKNDKGNKNLKDAVKDYNEEVKKLPKKISEYKEKNPNALFERDGWARMEAYRSAYRKISGKDSKGKLKGDPVKADTKTRVAWEKLISCYKELCEKWKWQQDLKFQYDDLLNAEKDVNTYLKIELLGDDLYSDIVQMKNMINFPSDKAKEEGEKSDVDFQKELQRKYKELQANEQKLDKEIKKVKRELDEIDELPQDVKEDLKDLLDKKETFSVNNTNTKLGQKLQKLFAEDKAKKYVLNKEK